MLLQLYESHLAEELCNALYITWKSSCFYSKIFSTVHFRMFPCFSRSCPCWGYQFTTMELLQSLKFSHQKVVFHIYNFHTFIHSYIHLQSFLLWSTECGIWNEDMEKLLMPIVLLYPYFSKIKKYWIFQLCIWDLNTGI